MRRAILAVTGLAAGTTLLVVLKGAPETTRVAEVAPTDRPSVVPAPAGAAPAPRPSDAPDATPGRDATRTSAAPAPTRTTRAPKARTTTTAPAPRRTTAPPRSTTRSVTGPVVGNEYGNVQVRITLDGSRIVNAVALELPEETAESDRRSSSVNSRYSGPSGEVVQQQDADLDTVSGATATSDSYRQSLQAAIDAARG